MDLSASFEFQWPTRTKFGLNIIEKLGEDVRSFDNDTVFIVTDKGVVDCGVLDRVLDVLKGSDIKYDVFDDVEPDPSVDTVHKGSDVFAKQPDRLLIGLGGGSSIDTAKAIGVAATHEGKINDYTRHGNKVVRNITPPLIAIPTTAGTGSEVTWVSVLTDHQIKRKIVVASIHIAPRLALLDPMLTKTLPPAVSASTGMDALTHAVESYVSVGSEPISDALAIKAIELIGQNLRTVVVNGDNLEARSEMLLASNFGGIAFINGKLGLVHATAQSLGGRHGIPHGVANAIMLPPVMKYNLSTKPSKFADIARALGEDINALTPEAAAEKSVEAVKKLSADIGIPKGLKELGIDESMLDPLADAALDDRGTVPFNPKEPTKADIIEIYKEVL